MSLLLLLHSSGVVAPVSDITLEDPVVLNITMTIVPVLNRSSNNLLLHSMQPIPRIVSSRG